MNRKLLILLTGLGIAGCVDSVSDEEPSAAAAPVAAAKVETTGADGEVTESNSNAKDESVASEQAPTHYNKLTEFEQFVILEKGTERAFVGEYTDTDDKGTYVCRRCNAALYQSDDKFHSDCGWPAFDDEIEGAVTHLPDADGFRTEIVCTNCSGHLGHVFVGERMTDKNTRHCVNSVSMTFVPDGQELPAAASSGATDPE